MHVLDEKKIEEIKAAFHAGLTRTAAAKQCGVGRDTVARYYAIWKSHGLDAVSEHATELARLAAMIESPDVIKEIDKVLHEKRNLILDLMALKQSALRWQKFYEDQEAGVTEPPSDLPASLRAQIERKGSALLRNGLVEEAEQTFRDAERAEQLAKAYPRLFKGEDVL